MPARAAAIPPDGFVIEFPDVGKPEAADLAKDLKIALDNAIADAGASAEIHLARVNPAAQDPGTILAIVLGAKATVALAAAVGLWMRRRNQARIRFTYPNQTHVDISGLESRDVAKIVAALPKTA